MFHRLGVNHKISKLVSCEKYTNHYIQWARTDRHTNELEQIIFTITTHIFLMNILVSCVATYCVH